MRLEELQGFVQGLWENLASGHGPGEGARLPISAASLQSSVLGAFPAPTPFLEQVLVLGTCMEKDQAQGLAALGLSKVCLPSPRDTALQPPDLSMV